MKTPLTREVCVSRADKKGRTYLFAKAEELAINNAVAGEWDCTMIPTSVTIFRNEKEDGRPHTYTFSCWFSGMENSALENARIHITWVMKFHPGGFVLLKGGNKVNHSLEEVSLNHLLPELVLDKIDEFWELVEEKVGLPF